MTFLGPMYRWVRNPDSTRLFLCVKKVVCKLVRISAVNSSHGHFPVFWYMHFICKIRFDLPPLYHSDPCLPRAGEPPAASRAAGGGEGNDGPTDGGGGAAAPSADGQERRGGRRAHGQTGSAAGVGPVGSVRANTSWNMRDRWAQI